AELNRQHILRRCVLQRIFAAEHGEGLARLDHNRHDSGGPGEHDSREYDRKYLNQSRGHDHLSLRYVVGFESVRPYTVTSATSRLLKIRQPTTSRRIAPYASVCTRHCQSRAGVMNSPFTNSAAPL